MQEAELIQLVQDLKNKKVEDNLIEIKSARNGCPTKIYDTLSSFSNQNEGGKILFGISEDAKFDVVGVYDSNQLINKIKKVCNEMEPVVKGVITETRIDNKSVVCLEVPGVDVMDRPVFYRGEGIANGSYIRIGDADMHMSAAEIYSYQAFKKRVKDDKRIVDDVDIKNINKEKIYEYLKYVKKERPNLNTNVTNEEILELMGIINNGKYTLTGVLVFSKYPQAYFPQYSITAVRIQGYKMGDLSNDGARFIDNKRITGTIDEMVEAAVVFVKKNSKIKIIIDEEGKRRDQNEYPLKAVREAVLNALVHRDYSIHTEGTPVTIEMYDDRLEITNPGGLYGNISVEQLGKSRPDTRNEILANTLEIMAITENRYSGIPTINKELDKQGLQPAKFINENGMFKVIFDNSKKHSVVKKKIKGKEIKEKIIEFCKTPRSREEIVEYTGLSKYYAINIMLKELINEGKIEMTMPEIPKSVKQRYYST